MTKKVLVFLLVAFFSSYLFSMDLNTWKQLSNDEKDAILLDTMSTIAWSVESNLIREDQLKAYATVGNFIYSMLFEEPATSKAIIYQLVEMKLRTNTGSSMLQIVFYMAELGNIIIRTEGIYKVVE